MATANLRIIVVEDEGVIAMLISDVLEQLGHKICAVAATEADAVAAAARERPDLMIVDAGLGDGSGLAAIDAILRTGFVPHVFVTGDAAGVRKVWRDAVVLEKPFGAPELVKAIDRAMGCEAERPIKATDAAMADR